MSDPIRSAAQGLRYWELKQAAMSNNLANVSTSGFKAESVYAHLTGGPGPSGGGATDLTEGAREVTGRPLDVSIEGDAFFVVRTAAGERYTRDGSFSLDANGTLVDKKGNAVLGSDGQSIVLPPGQVDVLTTGEILVDGAALGTFRLEAPAEGTRLAREGGVYFVPAGPGDSAEPTQVRVHQGQLEESNVDPILGMVDMLTIQRNYAALQRTISVADGIEGRIVNDISRVE
ncbi:MAG: flagellar hook-basal body protein [Longimicrobiales bacterium]